MRLLIFLIFSQYGLACKHGNIFQISIYNCNFLIPDVTVANQSNLFTFEIKYVFGLDVFKVDLVLKIKDN